ncbi:hypothetical protein NHP22001_14220 [Helicobacter sp. NHP22-001]|nr:hypothetical protein NHP22001_14220 [Helicobacter sp. NHP22-001]
MEGIWNFNVNGKYKERDYLEEHGSNLKKDEAFFIKAPMKNSKIMNW